MKGRGAGQQLSISACSCQSHNAATCTHEPGRRPVRWRSNFEITSHSQQHRSSTCMLLAEVDCPQEACLFKALWDKLAEALKQQKAAAHCQSPEPTRALHAARHSTLPCIDSSPRRVPTQPREGVLLP